MCRRWRSHRNCHVTGSRCAIWFSEWRHLLADGKSLKWQNTKWQMAVSYNAIYCIVFVTRVFSSTASQQMALIVRFPLVGSVRPSDETRWPPLGYANRQSCPFRVRVWFSLFVCLLRGQVSGMLVFSRCGESAFLRFSDTGERSNRQMCNRPTLKVHSADK